MQPITMRFATSRHKPASIYAHGNTTWQQSCSHSATICNQRFKNRIELRTYDAAVFAEHRGGTDLRQNERSAPAAHPRYLSSPAGATLHRKTQGFVPKLSPKTKPMQHPCSYYNAFCHLTSPTGLSLRTWQHHQATFMQPFHCDLQPKIPNHPITATHKHAQSTLKPHQQCGTKKHQNDRTRTRSTPEVPFIAGRPFIAACCYLMCSLSHRPSLQSVVI